MGCCSVTLPWTPATSLAPLRTLAFDLLLAFELELRLDGNPRQRADAGVVRLEISAPQRSQWIGGPQ